ncbi:MAG: SMP-30/gluconolactonase/LRE family protein [Alphaproteobacteria bacterium]
MAQEYQIAFQVRDELGEGPVFDERRNLLFWCDINSWSLHIGDIATGSVRSIGFGEPVSAVFLTEGAGILIAAARGLISFSPETGIRTPLIDIESGNALTRANDSRVAPGNAIWFGTMSRKLEADFGAYYHLAFPSMSASDLFRPITIPNATCFSPDGKQAYFCDTSRQQILTCKIDEDTGLPASPPEIFVDLSADGLNPDGAVIDSAGRLWNAQWGAGRVACYDSKGRFVDAIKLPASQLTCPCFGGADFKTLYVTSASEGISAGAEPLAGAVFAIEMDIPGLAERRITL